MVGKCDRFLGCRVTTITLTQYRVAQWPWKGYCCVGHTIRFLGVHWDGPNSGWLSSYCLKHISAAMVAEVARFWRCLKSDKNWAHLIPSSMMTLKGYCRVGHTICFLGVHCNGPNSGWLSSYGLKRISAAMVAEVARFWRRLKSDKNYAHQVAGWPWKGYCRVGHTIRFSGVHRDGPNSGWLLSYGLKCILAAMVAEMARFWGHLTKKMNLHDHRDTRSR